MAMCPRHRHTSLRRRPRVPIPDASGGRGRALRRLRHIRVRGPRRLRRLRLVRRRGGRRHSHGDGGCRRQGPRGRGAGGTARVLRILREQVADAEVLPLGRDDVSVVLQSHEANAPQLSIVQQFGQFRVAQNCLAERGVEACLEDAFQIRQPDTRLVCRQLGQQTLQISRKIVPCRRRKALVGARGEPLELLGALCLGLRARMVIRHNLAAVITEDFLHGDGELHDVANLPQRPAAEERHVHGLQGLRALVPPAGEHVLCARPEKNFDLLPHFRREDVLRAVVIDEQRGAPQE
mmetsp:Transcript_100056/g.305872  ORF Transcript_100056/g.305872 Transcript_100056/m.305872 type:complete len:293 (-) Transcript_100056:73-951(-)